MGHMQCYSPGQESELREVGADHSTWGWTRLPLRLHFRSLHSEQILFFLEV